MNNESRMIGDLIFSIHKEMKRTLERDLKTYDIGIGQLQILLLFYAVADKSFSQSEISKALGVDKGNVSRSIHKLVEKNYIAGTPEDERLFKLTDSGDALKSAISLHFNLLHDKISYGIDEHTLKVTSEVLSSIKERLEKL